MTQIREELINRDSRGPEVAQTVMVRRTGRKWSVQAAVLDEFLSHHKDLMDMVACGRVGLGMFPTLHLGGVEGHNEGRWNKQSGWVEAAGGLNEAGAGQGSEGHLDGPLAG